MSALSGHQLPGPSWLRREQIIERFEQCWRQTGYAGLASFRPQPNTLERGKFFLQHSQVDLEFRW
jgi:hypothetical protein